MSEEDRLLRAASRGDARAFEDLVRRLAPGLYAYMHVMLGDQHEAEDAMQDALVRAARALERYDGRTPLVSWVYRIARRVALDHPFAKAEDGTDPLRAAPPEHRELIAYRDVMGWDMRTIAAVLDVPDDDARLRLDAARGSLVPHRVN